MASAEPIAIALPLSAVESPIAMPPALGAVAPGPIAIAQASEGLALAL